MPIEIEVLFEEAISITSESDRRDFLESATTPDSIERDQLQRLVDSHFAAGEFMRRPVSVLLDRIDHPTGHSAELREASIGDLVGPYLLKKELGRGGMAVVYQAFQSEPIERQVALKVIRPGPASGQLIARMELERQTLAVMDHPNIARLYDAGVTSWGYPYYAMEMVDGVSIARYCKTNEASQDQRLRLIIEVCSAVEHAHRKGIIHRDLKPSNILVKQAEGKLEVKVIDFGIAKTVARAPVVDNKSQPEQSAPAHKVDGTEELTEMGQLIGTPQYMSPEQASLDSKHVDTRSDVYSIGAVLYELLTGDPPFSHGTVLEILNQIQSVEPAPPSRNIRGIPADLNAICMKCLEKNPDARYPSANDLALDLRRFLAGHPVQARRTSRLTRMWRWAKRAPWAATSAAVVVSALIGLLALWGSFTYQLKSQRDEIASTALQLDRERAHALQNFSRAHQAIQEALSIRLHTPIGTSDQLLFQKHLLETGLEFYAELLRENEQEEQLKAAPQHLAAAELERARLSFEYGKVLFGSHENDEALVAFESAKRFAQRAEDIGAEEESVDARKLQGVILTSIVQVHRRLGDHATALATAQQGLAQYQELIAASELTGDYAHWYQALSWNRIGKAQVELGLNAAARQSFDVALNHCLQLPAIYDFQLTHSDVLLESARLSRLEGRLAESLSTAQQALAIAEDTCLRSTPPLKRYQLARIRCLRELAVCQAARQDAPAVKATFKRAIQFQKVLVDSEPESEQFALGLAELYDQQAATLIGRDNAEASRLSEQAASIRQALDGRDLAPARSLIAARMRLDRAAYDLAQHDYVPAARQFHEALQLLEGIPAEYESEVVASLKLGTEFRLADAYFGATDYSAALAHYQNYFELTDLHSPGDRTALAVCLASSGASDQAAEVLQELETKLPNSNPLVAFIPLAQMIDLGTRGITDATSWRSVADDFRSLLDASDAMSDPQQLNAALALCQAVETIDAFALVSLDEFSSWAKVRAIGCLQSVVGGSPSIADRRIFADARLRCLVDEPSFQHWLSTVD